MSSHSGRALTLSPRARQDFVDILRYTGERWGDAQLVAYRDKIDGALQAITGNPQLGHRRADLPNSLRAYRVGAHVIVYRSDERVTGVVRILHQLYAAGDDAGKACQSA